MKYCTFFGGGLNDTTTPEYIETILIGELLSKLGYIVKCGGYRGLMEAVSLGVHNSNGQIIGYTCKTFPSVKGNKFLSSTIVCNDIYDRLRLLIQDSELFIVHRGGIGTLSELTLVLDENRKSSTNKIVVIGDYMKEKLTFLDEKEYNSIYFCKNYEDLVILLN